MPNTLSEWQRGGAEVPARSLHAAIFDRCCFRTKREQLRRFQSLLPECQAQHLALTVLDGPYSLDSGNVHFCAKPCFAPLSSITSGAAVERPWRMRRLRSIALPQVMSYLVKRKVHGPFPGAGEDVSGGSDLTCLTI